MPMFTTTTSVQARRCELAVIGEIDLSCADDFESVAVRALTESGVSTLVVGLAGVSFMDATGLRALVRIRNTALGLDKQLVLDSPSAQLQKTLRITGLHTVFACTTAPKRIVTSRQPATRR